MSFVGLCARSVRVAIRNNSWHTYTVQTRSLARPEFLKRFSTASNASTSDQSKDPFQQPYVESSAYDEKVFTPEAKEAKETVSETEKELMEKNKELIERITELNDKYKRSLADNENIRQRMRREIADAKQFGIQNFVKDLLEVADVLNKAVEAVPKDALDNASPHFKNLFEGLQMTEAQLQAVLRRHGVTQVNPLGEKFNPNIHEALFEQEDSSKEPGTVGLVTKVGYKLHDRIVRPALVGVIKATPSS